MECKLNNGANSMDLTKESLEMMSNRLFEKLDKIDVDLRELKTQQSVFFERLIKVETNLDHLEIDTKESIENAITKMQIKYYNAIVAAFVVPIMLAVMMKMVLKI